MADSHPTTPPPELIDQLANISPWKESIVEAYRAGANMELEACVEWLAQNCGRWELSSALRAARRPKPPSPKEEALQVLEALIESRRIVDPEYQALRHALEQLND